MNNIIEKGYAEKVPDENLHRGDGKVWCIPHHGVYHQKKNKICVVFECNASYQGFSLNGQLLQGPNLTNTLIGVLTRFRKEPIAMMADIESMFYQVRVPILSVVGSVYDPLGFLALFVLPAKLILKGLCREKIAWDEEIAGKKDERWLSWLEDLQKFANFSVSRCIKPAGFGHVKTFQLHHFCRC